MNVTHADDGTPYVSVYDLIREVAGCTRHAASCRWRSYYKEKKLVSDQHVARYSVRKGAQKTPHVNRAGAAILLQCIKSVRNPVSLDSVFGTLNVEPKPSASPARHNKPRTFVVDGVCYVCAAELFRWVCEDRLNGQIAWAIVKKRVKQHGNVHRIGTDKLGLDYDAAVWAIENAGPPTAKFRANSMKQLAALLRPHQPPPWGLQLPDPEPVTPTPAASAAALAAPDGADTDSLQAARLKATLEEIEARNAATLEDIESSAAIARHNAEATGAIARYKAVAAAAGIDLTTPDERSKLTAFARSVMVGPSATTTERPVSVADYLAIKHGTASKAYKHRVPIGGRAAELYSAEFHSRPRKAVQGMHAVNVYAPSAVHVIDQATEDILTSL
ncbi:MAG: hypothetical protein ACPGR8_13475 [Limisphaerales bacterium]